MEDKLKIYVLEREWDYDEEDGCTVLAINESEAKIIAKKELGWDNWEVDRVEELNHSKLISSSFHHG